MSFLNRIATKIDNFLKLSFPDASSPQVGRIIERAKERSPAGNLRFPFNTSVSGKEITQKVIEDAKQCVRERTHSRWNLSQLYSRAIEDMHVMSNFTTAFARMMGRGRYLVEFSNEEDPAKAPIEVQRLISKSWFYELAREWLLHEWHGVSLLHFQINELTGEVVNISSVERGFLDTNNKLIRIPKDAYVVAGLEDQIIEPINYEEAPEYLEILHGNNPYALGLLYRVTRLVALKSRSYISWMILNSGAIYPTYIYNRKSANKDDIIAVNEAFMQPDSARIIPIDTEDKITRLDHDDNDIHESYQAIIQNFDSEISRGINGQTLTTDRVSQASSAEVQERVLNSFIHSKREQFSLWVESILFPYLENINNGNNPYASANISQYRLVFSDPVANNTTNLQATPPSQDEKKDGNPNAN